MSKEDTLTDHRVVYASRDHACLECDGVIVHARRAGNRIEARTLGPGGPMSGDAIARSDNGIWTIPPSDAEFRIIDEMFERASSLLREKASAERASSI